jgi:hypothetical protein
LHESSKPGAPKQTAAAIDFGFHMNITRLDAQTKAEIPAW